MYPFTQTEFFSPEKQSTFALLGAPRLQFPIGWVCSPKQIFCRVIFAKSSPMFFLSSDPRQKNPSKDSLNENLYNRYLQQTLIIDTWKKREALTIDTYNRCLQQKLTINTCNRHLQQTLTMDTIDAYNRHLQQTLTMDTCNRHFQQTLTIDTYNRHHTHQGTC